LLYFITSLYFLVVAGALALLMRTQLAIPNAEFLPAGSFNQSATVHGLLAVLWFLSPMAFAFANYFVPLQIGARDLAFPRLNAMSYWLYLFGGLLAAIGFFTPGGAIATGWTVYAPLSTPQFSREVGVTLGGAGLLMLIASATLSTVNFLVTIFRYRCQGMSISKMPMFTWGILLTVFMMLYAFPSLAAGVLMLASERLLGTTYFSAKEGGAMLWAHVFWFFGHPEVYIVLWPGLAAVAEIIPVFARRPLYGRKFVVGALVMATAISFIVWVHHMFVTGTNPILREFMTITTETISIPFGVIILSLIITLHKSSIRFKTPMLFAVGAVALFIIGGVTGVFNSSVALDYGLRGTYWVVGHFHYTLVGGALTGLVAALYYWWPKITGRMYSEKLGRLHFVLYIISFNILYFPMSLLGDMPRRVYTYAPETGWWTLNLLASIGAFVFAISWLIPFANFFRSVKHGEPAGDNPWEAPGIEWTVSSPPPAHNFDQMPVIANDGTIISGGMKPDGGSMTHSSTATADHTGHFSAWPVLISLGAFVTLLGTYLGLAFLLTGAAIVAIVLIGWGKDDIGRRFAITEHVAGERWPFEKVNSVRLGVWFFLPSEVMLFGTLIGAYWFVRMGSATWPARGEILSISHGALNTFILLTSSLTLVLALASAKTGSRRGLQGGLLATFLLAVLFLANKAYEWMDLFAKGFTFSSGLPASAYYITTGAHGVHIVGGLLVLAYLIFKSFMNESAKDSHPTVESFGLYWHFVDTAWVFLFPLFYLI
jgi:cytochrome c oxidase subunit I+III